MKGSVNKLLMSCFLFFSLLVGLTISILLKVFSGAFGVIAKLSSNDLFKHGVPVLVVISLFMYLSLNKKLIEWSNEVIVEIKKIVWPPLKDVKAMTIVVVLMVFISSLIVSLFDLFSGYVLTHLMK